MHKILVVDDDKALLGTIGRILRSRGYEVQLASDGLEGLRLFRSHTPELVITDIFMPVKEGLDTILLLRTWSPELKIIAITGGGKVGKQDAFAAAADLGAWTVLAKPFTPEELLASVSECLAV
jgi:CheY-like chemotaxis protein